MAKQAEAKSATETQSRQVAKKEISPGGASVPASRSLQTATTSNPTAREDVCPTSKPSKPSSLLDTRVVYCGDNLEQPGQMQNEKCRMMKPARSVILHSSFILLNFPVPASHYVKVMLDQILGENNSN
jgi:hypothetical protein